MSEPTKVEAEFVVGGELGLHARPAGRFAALAARYESEISVALGGEWVDARSVLSLLSLGLACGVRVRLRAVGTDAEEAVRALGELLENPAEPN